MVKKASIRCSPTNWPVLTGYATTFCNSHKVPHYSRGDELELVFYTKISNKITYQHTWHLAYHQRWHNPCHTSTRASKTSRGLRHIYHKGHSHSSSPPLDTAVYLKIVGDNNWVFFYIYLNWFGYTGTILDLQFEARVFKCFTPTAMLIFNHPAVRQY